ncbi:hypothetical protein GCM10027167_71640 [Nocardia heshunensis]
MLPTLGGSCFVRPKFDNAFAIGDTALACRVERAIRVDQCGAAGFACRRAASAYERCAGEWGCARAILGDPVVRGLDHPLIGVGAPSLPQWEVRCASEHLVS